MLERKKEEKILFRLYKSNEMASQSNLVTTTRLLKHISGIISSSKSEKSKRRKICLAAGDSPHWNIGIILFSELYRVFISRISADPGSSIFSDDDISLRQERAYNLKN